MNINLMDTPLLIERFSAPFKGQVESEVGMFHQGRVRFQATSWFAQLYPDSDMTLHPGEWVNVIGRQGLTLLVVPINQVSVPLHALPQGTLNPR